MIKKIKNLKNLGTLSIGGLISVAVFSFIYFGPSVSVATYEAPSKEQVAAPQNIFVPIRMETPVAVKAVYMSQCVAGTPSFREYLANLIDETELNSVIIDIKDYTGKIAFPTNNPELSESVSDQCGARDMKEFIKSLNERGIYVIGRITVFQDPFYTGIHPELAVKKASATSTVWTDYKGLSFIDVGAKDYWKYIVSISKEAYEIGFDELNYDYIRYPSDGNMNDIHYPFSEERIIEDPDLGKAKILRNFFSYLNSELNGVVLSADLFGMTTTNPDDLNIGQILEYAEPYFDYIAPMVYPSHYPKDFNGYANPNNNVYGVIKFSMDSGVERLIAASSSPLKLRPWLQDFDYGGNYGPEEVRAQIQATYDAGLTSWMLWDPSNRYTREALEEI